MTYLWTRLARALWRRREIDRDIEDEIRFHLAEEARLHSDRGRSAPSARQMALRDFGNPTLIREDIRRLWTSVLLDTLAQDLKYALRSYLKRPGLTLTIVAILGVGIAANATMFTVIRTVLLSPLNYAEPDRLVHFGIRDREDGAPRLFSWMRLEEMKASQQSFSALGGYLAFPEDMTFAGPETSEALTAARVSSNYLDILGVAPLLGRSFLEEEEVSDGPFVAMVSSRMWERHFGSRPFLSGQAAVLDGRAYTIVGVLPPGFEFPFPEIDVWTTRPFEPAYLELGSGPRVNLLYGIARLKPNVTVEQAQTEFDVLTDAYRRAHPEAGEYGTGPMRVTALDDHVTGDFQTMLWTLFGAVGFVLLIACANGASLLMARAASRSREFAVRTAVGAGRARLTRQLVTESVLLAVVAGGFGVAGAAFATRVISSTSLIDLPRIGEAEIDLAVLGFALVLSLATGVVFGLFPALQTRRISVGDQLRQSGNPSLAPSWRTFGFGMRNLLVIFQVALSMILLVGAGLLMRSVVELSGVDLGFRPEGLLTARVPLPTARYDTPEKRANFFREAAAAIAAIPGIDSLTFSRSLPTTVNALNTNMGIPDNPIPSARLQTVTPGYFETMGIPLIRGRSLTARDDQPDAAAVAVVNERFRRMVWPDDSNTSAVPVGFDRLTIPLVLRASGHRHLEIVGVAGDVQENGMIQDAGPVVYVPQHLYPPQTAYLAVRARGDPATVLDGIRDAIGTIDPTQPVTDVRTMDNVLGASVTRQRLAAWLLGLFAGAALFLSLAGIYGAMAYAVTVKRPEIGIRRALGAQPGDIQRGVLGRGLTLVLVGLILGLSGATALSRILNGLLFNTRPLEPSVMIGVGILFVVSAVMALTVPAWRAGRIDPAETLRSE